VQVNYHHHYSEAEVEDILTDAQALVRRLDLDAELFRAAFEKAVDLLSNKMAVPDAGPVMIPGAIVRGH
jgi:hypothetical protein